MKKKHTRNTFGFPGIEPAQRREAVLLLSFYGIAVLPQQNSAIFPYHGNRPFGYDGCISICEWVMGGTLVETMPREKKQPDTENARIARAIMAKVRVVASRLGMTAPEYLNDRLAPIVSKDYAEIVQQMAKEVAADKRKH